MHRVATDHGLSIAGKELLDLDTGILQTIAGIGMSFAGFAGLVGALRVRSDAWHPAEVHWVTGIVTAGFGVMLFSLAPIALLGLFDAPTVFSGSAAGLALFAIFSVVRGQRSGRKLIRDVPPEMRRRGRIFLFVPLPSFIVLPLAIYTGRIEFYELSLLATLLAPIVIFGFVLQGVRGFLGDDPTRD